MDMSPPPPLNSTRSSPSITTTTTTTTTSMMMSTLFSSTDTALFSEKWKPSNTAQYAGLCFFLIIFAALFRGLLSYSAMLEHGRQPTESQRKPVVPPGEKQDDDGGRLRANDIGAGARRNSSPMGTGSPWRKSIPWRLSTDVPRASLDTIIAGVGYFLMIAVMTMNVGYICSVLGGTFLGSLICGRFAVNLMPKSPKADSE